MARTFLLILGLALSQLAVAAESQWVVIFGRGTESADTDILRLAYRQPLTEGTWWKPTHVQLGADVWRVPDIRGVTRRFDLSVSAIWRAERGWGYYEGGFGGYLLTKTINNDENRVPSAFEFGSHLGIGMRLAGDQSIGIAYQHLSNAGIKQPNGGIDLVLIQYTLRVR